MGCRFSIAGFVLLTSLTLPSGFGLIQKSIAAEKVIASKMSSFSLLAVETAINEGDKAITKEDLSKARNKYDDARTASKALASFYRSLSGSFRGLDARIPREMDKKGRKAQILHAEANLRLAALFRRQDKPQMAVPVLIEVVQLMTPAKPQGQKAYQSLLELGFVDTPYSAIKSTGLE